MESVNRSAESSYSVKSEHPLKHIIWPGGNLFPSSDDSHVLVSDGWLTTYSDIRLRRLEIPSLSETASVQTWDSVRAITFNRDQSVLAGCVFKKRTYVLSRTSLDAVAVIDGLGEGLDCLAFTPSGEFLVVGGNLHETVKIIDPGSWTIARRKRVGHTSSILMGADPDEVMLLHGPTGRVAWFDCRSGAVKHEIRVPPFRQAVQLDSSVFLSTGFAEPVSIVPKDNAQYFADNAAYRPADFASFAQVAREERASILQGLLEIPGHVPMVGMEQVKVIAGVATVDSVGREMKEHRLIRPFPSPKVENIQRSRSGQRLHLFSPGIVRTLRSDDLSLESDWLFSGQLRPLAVLDEGRAAVVVSPASTTGVPGQNVKIIERI